MTEQLRNSASDEDWLQALQEVEAIAAEIDEEKEASKARIATIKDRQKRKVEMLCRELGMDKEVFKAMLADRAEDRKYEAAKAKRAAKIPDSKVEVFLDALGQFSWLPPAEGAEPETPAERAARERIEAIQRVTDQEQAEGAAALDELASSESVH